MHAVNRLAAVAIMAATASGSLLTSCSSSERVEQVTHSVMTVKPSNVSEMTIKRFSGIVKENAEISLGFKTAGQLESIYVKEGDHVRKGQLMAVLDDKDYRLGVDAVQYQYDQVKDEVARLQKLYQGKSLSANDYEKAVSGMNQLGVQLEVNKNKLDYTRLYAPQNSVVQGVNFEVSEMVDAGTPVFTLIDNHRMEVEISMPVGVYNRRKDFGEVYCIVDGERYPLQLTSILPKADSNQLFTAKFSISADGLTAGVNAEVVISIASATADGVCTVPPHTVFEECGRTFVWVVDTASVVQRREVSVSGVDDDGCLIVASGLTGDETIVRAGVNALHDQEAVKVIGARSESNVGDLL